MLKALTRTITEILDSRKAAYSFIAVAGAITLHLYFKVSVQDSLLLVSPLGLATAAQAHVDAKQGSSKSATHPAAVPATAATSGPTAPAV